MARKLLAREQKTFLKKFLPAFFIPYAGIHFIDFSSLTNWLASLEADALNAVGYYSEAIGSSVLTNYFLFDIVVDCSGLFLLILFLALVYSTESFSALNKKVFVGLIVALFLFNLLRLFFTAWATLEFGLKTGEGLHFALWFVDSGVVFLAWVYATNRVSFPASAKAKRK